MRKSAFVLILALFLVNYNGVGEAKSVFLRSEVLGGRSSIYINQPEVDAGSRLLVSA